MKSWLARLGRIALGAVFAPARLARWGRYVVRGCKALIAMILLLCLLMLVLLVVFVRRSSASGERTELDVLLVVDNSNSMFDKGGIGSDPELRRIEAAQMFIDYLGVDSGPVSHRLGVIFFGGEAQLVVPLTPLADQSHRQEMAALIADPQRMDWTNPVAALTLAREVVLAEESQAHQPVVILLTDGKPEWDATPSHLERQSVLEKLDGVGRQYASDGIQLFVVLLANEVTGADPEIESIYVPLWKELTGAAQGRFYPVHRADDLITVYHDILVCLSDVRTAGPVVEAEIEEETRVELVSIEPDLARVTFLVRVSHPDVAVTLHLPDGRKLGSDDANTSHGSHGTTAI